MESPIHTQRSCNTTPHHHYYTNSSGDQQPKSFDERRNGENSGLRVTPRLYTPTNYSGGKKRRSRTHTPSVHSSGDGGSIIMAIDNSLPPSLIISDNMLNSSGGSHSITPPNSNSNTTISCGSGNSTSANIGLHTTTITPKTTLNHNNNHINRQTDLENLKNNSSLAHKIKKSILEEDDDIEKCVAVGVGRTRTSWVGPSQEFLPICDALFNMICLAAYFCDIVFDCLTAYDMYRMSQETDDFLSLSPEEMEQHQQKSLSLWNWSMVAIAFITLSTVLCQTLSFLWYKNSAKRGQIGPDGIELEGPPPPSCSTGVIVMHLSFSGILWRYIKLFFPVDLRFVKNYVRDLILLRMVHAFCEAIPLLIIKLYLIWGSSGPETVSDFIIVSTSLSLFSVCLALASFSKNIRKQNVHKLVFTWLGVIFQLLWHVGTVISRVVALSLYATVYGFWIFAVLILHFFCMLMWLISPNNLYQGEKISTLRKLIYSTLLSVVYTFDYVNVQERNSRKTVLIYYVTMFLENNLLLGLSLIAKRYEEEDVWYRTKVINAVVLSPFVGLVFMCLYYYFFHLKQLSYYDTESSSMLNGGSSANINGTIYTDNNGKGRRGVVVGEPNASFEIELSNNNKNMNGIISPSKEANGMIISNGGSKHGKQTPEESYNKKNGSSHPHYNNNNKSGLKSDKAGASVGGQRGALYNKINGHHIHHHSNVPSTGVFNCRFHPAMKRKKKKPSSFVPPPAVQTTVAQEHGGTAIIENQLHQSNASNIIRVDSSFEAEDQHQRSQSINYQNSLFNDNNSGGNDILRAMSPEFAESLSSGVTSNGGKFPIILPGGRMSHPFWKRPLSITLVGSENEGSVGSRVDIQQKLQEKKQQQLAELKKIEEEIKQGKLKRPLNEIPQSVSVRQPIPFEKKQPWFSAAHGRHGETSMDPPALMYPRPPFTIHSTTTDPNDNEVILDPQYLMYASPLPHLNGEQEDEDSCYYDNPDWPTNYYEPESMYHNGEIQDHSSNSGGVVGGIQRRRRNAKNRASKESIYKSYRMPSDIDSQMSLPRSYTLPREFKYKRKFRKPIKNEQFVQQHSTNSSDGDVDSGEENPEIYGTFGPYPLPLPSIQHIRSCNNSSSNVQPTTSSSSAPPQLSKKHPMSRRQKLHETKL